MSTDATSGTTGFTAFFRKVILFINCGHCFNLTGRKMKKNNKLENCKEKSLPSSNSVCTKNLVKTNDIFNKKRN